MIAGLYYDLNVDYATQIWEEFIKILENTNVVKGILCTRYWSLALQSVYEKEGIPIPTDEAKAEIMKYHFPKIVEDDLEVYPNVARIPDGMLKKIDPTNSVLVAYLKHVNPSVKTRILLKICEEGSSKKVKKLKKGADDVVHESPNKQTKYKSPKKITNETEKPKEKVVDEFQNVEEIIL